MSRSEQMQESVSPLGIRGRLGELCFRSGLLRVLQQVRAWKYRDLRILAYHRIVTVADTNRFDFDLDLVSASAEQFREQMLLVKQRFVPVRLGDAAAAMEAGQTLPAGAVVVTFDDGYDDNYHVAYPILRELGLPATFFVSTGHIDSGRPYAYDWLVHTVLSTSRQHLSAPELGLNVPLPAGRIERRKLARDMLGRLKALDGVAQSALIDRLTIDLNVPWDKGHVACQPMNWDQLREMHAAGFEIGSHGVHHRMLAKLVQDDLESELRESKATLDRELGAPTTLISYPVGGNAAFDDRVVQATIAAGYRAGCSYICGTNRMSDANRYALYRLPVEREMSAGWFASMLTLPELMSYPTVNRIA
ncbi:MAG: polysaccharide deacetylase family protein [Rhodanobacter sp.]